MFETKLKNLSLVMWEKAELPERTYDDKEKKWNKTGNNIEMTIYTFRNETGETISLYSKDNSYRELEGKTVNVMVEIGQREFQGKKTTRVKLAHVEAV